MSLPLAGLKVLDLARALSGPFSTMILADLGAEVIKVEPTPDGDMVRQWGPFDTDISVYYLSANRTKKGIRSEEHTSELQSLMRTSYAVFRLKKKTEATAPLSQAANHPTIWHFIAPLDD